MHFYFNDKSIACNRQQQIYSKHIHFKSVKIISFAKRTFGNMKLTFLIDIQVVDHESNANAIVLKSKASIRVLEFNM